MNIVDRVKNILLTPKTEWPVIAGEAGNAGQIYTGYVLPLAVIPLVAGVIGSGLLASKLGIGFMGALVGGLFGFVITFIIVFLAGLIANALAPSFNGEKNDWQALKWIAYSFTAGWVAGIFNIIPVLGGVLAFIGTLYGIYLMYLGATPVMKVPEEKAVGYTAVVVVILLVISVVFFMIVGGIVAMLGFGAAAGLGAFR